MFISFIVDGGANAVTSVPVRVAGYPLGATGVATGEELATHPILGRLACPSLTRLNLLRKESEGFLLSRIEVEPSGTSARWKLELKPGLHWWSGEPVTGQDLARFLEEKLRPQIVEMSLGLWPVPEFVVSSTAPKSVTVSWAKTPSFGPFVLSRIPFTRTSKEHLECAGDYRMVEDAAATKLVPVAKGTTLREVWLNHTDKDETPADIDFQFSEVFTGASLAAIAQDKAQCARPIDLPVVTVISWDPNGRFTAEPDFRRALTQAVPRGALLRAGTGLLGDLVSGPLLRAHPGYDKSLLVRPFDLRQAAETLERLKYRRPLADSTRLTPEGKPLELALYSPQGVGLLQKVIVDSFNMLGIRVTFVADPKASFDGALSGMALPWPDADFLTFVHSKAPRNAPFWGVSDKELDARLEAYALSLTRTKPDFQELQMIHRILYNLEPFTILVQHRTCLVTHTKFRADFPKVIIRNPDWFFELING